MRRKKRCVELRGKKGDLPSGLPPSWPPVLEVSPSLSALVSFFAHCPPLLAKEIKYSFINIVRNSLNIYPECHKEHSVC